MKEKKDKTLQKRGAGSDDTNQQQNGDETQKQEGEGTSGDGQNAGGASQGAQDESAQQQQDPSAQEGSGNPEQQKQAAQAEAMQKAADGGAFDTAAVEIVEKGLNLEYAVRSISAHFNADEPAVKAAIEERVRVLQAEKQQAASPDDELVAVNVPKGFRLRLDNQIVVPVSAGAQRLPRRIAEHWYAKANGVKLV